MARTEARLLVEIWNPGSDFTGMTSDAQWMYFLLLSQPDLAHDGVLALRERRWARCAQDVTVEQIRDRLTELEKADKVVVDEDTEEVLVRSFVRGDKVYRQPNVLRAAADHLPLVASARIRSSLYEELLRVQELDMPEGSRSIVAGMLEALTNPSPKGSTNPSGNPSPKGTVGTPGERGVVTAVSTGFPVPRSPGSPDPEKPTPSSSSAATAAVSRANGKTSQAPTAAASADLAADAAAGDNAGTILGAFIDYLADPQRQVQLPASIKGQYAKHIKAALDSKIPSRVIRSALASLAEDGIAGKPSLLPNRIVDVQNRTSRPRSSAARSPTGTGASYPIPPDSDYTEDP